MNMSILTLSLRVIISILQKGEVRIEKDSFKKCPYQSPQKESIYISRDKGAYERKRYHEMNHLTDCNL